MHVFSLGATCLQELGNNSFLVSNAFVFIFIFIVNFHPQCYYWIWILSADSHRRLNLTIVNEDSQAYVYEVNYRLNIIGLTFMVTSCKRLNNRASCALRMLGKTKYAFARKLHGVIYVGPIYIFTRTLYKCNYHKLKCLSTKQSSDIYV